MRSQLVKADLQFFHVVRCIVGSQNPICDGLFFCFFSDPNRFLPEFFGFFIYPWVFLAQFAAALFQRGFGSVDPLKFLLNCGISRIGFGFFGNIRINVA